MCFEVNESPVERESEQTSENHTEPLNSEVYSEVHSEEKNSEVHLEVHSEVHLEEKSGEQHVLEEQPEQSLSQVHHLTLQDWLDRENQSHASKISCTQMK